MERWLKEGYTFVVTADLKSYFDTIDHERLMERVKEQVSDGRVLELIEAYLHQETSRRDGEDGRRLGGHRKAR